MRTFVFGFLLGLIWMPSISFGQDSGFSGPKTVRCQLDVECQTKLGQLYEYDCVSGRCLLLKHDCTPPEYSLQNEERVCRLVQMRQPQAQLHPQSAKPKRIHPRKNWKSDFKNSSRGPSQQSLGFILLGGLIAAISILLLRR